MSAPRHAILAVERRLANAVLARRRDDADAVLAPDFSSVGHSGNAVDRATYLGIHFAPERDFTVFETDEQQIGSIGEAALVTGRVRMVNAKLAANPPPARYSAVYVPNGDGWWLRFWQETPIATADF